jgi:ABC-2 type transport system ATP-binding protein
MNTFEVNKITKDYGNFDLQELSFSLKAGQIIGCIGDNGAGKTTLIKMLMGLTLPDSGSIYYFDKELKGNEKAIKNMIAYVPDTIPFPDHFTVKFSEKLFRGNFEKWDGEKFCSYITKFDLPWDKKFRDMSKGMKIKWLFALVLSYHPKLLIMDEATAGLDPVTRDFILKEIIKLKEKESLSVFMSTHILSDLDYLKADDRILILKDGVMINNEKKEEILDKSTRAHEKRFEQYLIKLLGENSCCG